MQETFLFFISYFTCISVTKTETLHEICTDVGEGKDGNEEKRNVVNCPMKFHAHNSWHAMKTGDPKKGIAVQRFCTPDID